MKITAALCVALAVAGCATKEQSALGQVAHSGGMFNGAPVYEGDISRKYRVLKEIHIRKPQIPGPNYYDHLSGYGWLSAAGRDLGADAVIKARTARIPGETIFNPGHFEAHGVTVKFTQ